MSTSGNLYSISTQGYNINQMAVYEDNVFFINLVTGTNSGGGIFVLNPTATTNVFGVPVTKNTPTALIYGAYTGYTTTVNQIRRINTLDGYISGTDSNCTICVDSNNNVWFTYTRGGTNPTYLCVIMASSIGGNFSSSVSFPGTNPYYWVIVYSFPRAIATSIQCDSNNNVYLACRDFNNVTQQDLKCIYVYSRTAGQTLYGISVTTAYYPYSIVGNGLVASKFPITDSSGVLNSLSKSIFENLYSVTNIRFDSDNNMLITYYGSDASSNVLRCILLLCKTTGIYYGKNCVANHIYILVKSGGIFNTVTNISNIINTGIYEISDDLSIDVDNNLFINGYNGVSSSILVIPRNNKKSNYFPGSNGMGNVYVLTGNGSTTFSTQSNVYPNSVTFTYSCVFLSSSKQSNTLYFTTYNYTKILYILPGDYQPPGPIRDISFDIVNTKTISAGNLQVSINDANNRASNYLYYWYSVSPQIIPNINSNVLNVGPSGSPYKFYISTDISSTIYVQAKDDNGNTSNIANIKVISYITPRNPPVFNVSFVSSGNIQVIVGELDTPSTIPPYYYLNKVSYVAYLYTGGTNQSGNLRYYTSNVGILSNTNTTYGNVVSYISGLSANTYTVYLAAKNDFGNSLPTTISKSVNVYTTPGNVSLTSATIVAEGNLQVIVNDTSNTTLNGVYYYYSTDGGTSYANSNVPNNGPTQTSYTLYIPYNPTNIQSFYVRAQNNIGFSTEKGLNIYSPYNTSLYKSINQSFIDNSTNYSFTVTGLSNKTYGVYLRSKNALSYSESSTEFNTTVYITPFNSVKFDIGNTNTISSRNLQVSIIDTSNTSLNEVYYQYSLNSIADANFANTFVRAGTSPYTFFVPSITDISNTIYVRASNTIGNSSPAANLQVIVYQTPRTPPQVSFQLVSSGNVQVTIIESTSTPDNYYYLNNVSYYLYAYNNANGTNLSGNTSTLVYNRSVGILSNTNSSYENVVSYVNTGLNADTYTMYVIATNPFGNSDPISSNITVYTTPDFPPQIDLANTISATSGNLTVSFTDPSNNPMNAIYYWYYVYDPSGTNNSGNISYYANSYTTLTTGAQQSFSLYGYVNKTYTLYLHARNVVGNSVYASTNVTIFTTPLATVSIDTNDTKTVASGNLQVSINDLSNTSLNGVYYYYAVNSTSVANFSNTFVKAGTSPYTFFVPSITDISNTIYVRASNTIGNSSPAANLQVIVYKTPRTPPQVSFQLVSSGNVQVTINESISTPDNYYYLNNVSYYLYAFNTANGTNLSGNTSTLVYNKPVGILSNTNSSYENVVSYVNTGLNANTYTMYVIAKNPFGNSVPISSNITVYTTPDFPPKIDIGNTISATSGNLSVSFTDPSNNPQNAISYWYYVYDPSGTNNSGNISYYANSYTTLTTGAQQSFPLTGFINKTYTLYLLSRNVVGDSASTSTNVTVYTVPTDILIDNANTYTISSGNLQVSVVDPSNGTNNGVYYQYSVNSSQYANAENIVSIGSTIKQFIIPGLPNGSFSINVVAKNTVGTSNANTFTRISYVLPQYAPVIDQANTLSKTSGNLIITFTDASNVALNDITYSYYIYDPSPPYNKIVFI